MTISLFFGVGELVTGLVVIAGVIFVGDTVLDIIQSLVRFVKLAKAATNEAGLRAAAQQFAHALTLGAAIVAALILHKAASKFKPGNVPEGVVRNGGTGQKKPLTAVAEEAAEGKSSGARKPPQIEANEGGVMGKRAVNKGFDGVKTTKNGGPTFKDSEYLYPAKAGERNIVTIKMQGGRSADFREVNKAAGLPGSKAPKGYTWHHLDDYNPQTGTCTMELVKTEAHVATFPHKGSVYQYEQATGNVYK